MAVSASLTPSAWRFSIFAHVGSHSGNRLKAGMQVALPEPRPQDLKARLQMRWTCLFDVGRIRTAVTTCANNTSRIQLGCSSR